MTDEFATEMAVVKKMADVERAIAAHEEQVLQEGGLVEDPAYLRINGGFFRLKQHKNGTHDLEKLSNFCAEITSETTKTDGAVSRKYFTMAATHCSGRPLSKVDVEASEFDRMEWVTRAWGASAQIYVGTRFKDHVAAAIKALSNPTSREVYQHTGWIELGSEHFYLTADGAIGSQGWEPKLETELLGALADYRLPPPDDCLIDLDHILSSFTQLIPGALGLLMLGGAFRAVLSHFVPCTVSIYLQGTTGTRKSAVAGVVQSFFGSSFHGAHLPDSWSTTENALEKKAFLTKDAIYVIDDFVARGTQVEVARLHARAERVLRAQGNQSGRDRMNSKAELRGAPHPRGMIFATGEDIPNGHSLQARCVVMSIDKDAVSLKLLSNLQRLGEEAQLAQVMSRFVMDIAVRSKACDITGEVKAIEAKIKSRLIDNGHARMPSNLATLLSGLFMFLESAIRRGDITETAASGFRDHAISAALILCRLQASMDGEASDAHRFIDVLKAAISMGEAHIVDRNGERPPNCTMFGWQPFEAKDHIRHDAKGARIGFVDRNFLYLDPNAAIAVAKALSSKTGNHIGSSERALSKALKEAGLLARVDEGRATIKATLAGQRRSVYCLKLASVFELDHGEPAKMPPEFKEPANYDLPF